MTRPRGRHFDDPLRCTVSRRYVWQSQEPRLPSTGTGSEKWGAVGDAIPVLESGWTRVCMAFTDGTKAQFPRRRRQTWMSTRSVSTNKGVWWANGRGSPRFPQLPPWTGRLTHLARFTLSCTTSGMATTSTESQCLWSQDVIACVRVPCWVGWWTLDGVKVTLIRV